MNISHWHLNRTSSREDLGTRRRSVCTHPQYGRLEAHTKERREPDYREGGDGDRLVRRACKLYRVVYSGASPSSGGSPSCLGSPDSTCCSRWGKPPRRRRARLRRRRGGARVCGAGIRSASLRRVPPARRPNPLPRRGVGGHCVGRCIFKHDFPLSCAAGAFGRSLPLSGSQRALPRCRRRRRGLRACRSRSSSKGDGGVSGGSVSGSGSGSGKGSGDGGGGGGGGSERVPHITALPGGSDARRGRAVCRCPAGRCRWGK